MKLSVYDKISEGLYSTELDNGLNIYVIPKKGFNKSYAFFASNYGAADRRFKYNGEWIDTPGGVAHFLEHKMFDTEEGNALADLSANGASPNAFTSAGMTAYHFESTENFEQNLKILLDFVSVPYFTKESVDKEQGIIGQEIRMIEDNPGHAVYYNFLKALYKQNPVKDPIAGTIESIAQITADTLYNCHKTFYNPANMALVVTADIDPSRVADIAHEVLPREKGTIPERDYGREESLTPAEGKIEVKMEVSTPLFMLGCKVKPTEDGRAFLKRQLIGKLALALLCGKSSPLYARLYAKGIINSDFSWDFDALPGGAMCGIGGESREPENVLDEVQKEAETIISRGADAILFERIKKSAYGSKIRALNSFDSICYSQAEGHFKGYNPFESFDVLNEITPSDIESFIAECFLPDRLAMSIVRPI